VAALTATLASLHTGLAPDSWWHLAIGRDVLQGHLAIPRADVYSWTVPGRSLMVPSWLADAIAYSVHSVLGVVGLRLLTLVSIVTAVVLTGLRSPRARPAVQTIILMLVGLVVGLRATPRPDAATLFGVAALVWYLDRPKRPAHLPVVAGLALWANIHAGFAVGLGLLTLDLLGRFLGSSGSLADRLRKTRHPAGILVTSLLAVAVLNPYGPSLLLYPIRTLRLDILREAIVEWQSLTPTIDPAQFFIVVGLTGLALTGAITRRGEERMIGLLRTTVFATLAFLAIRNASLFCLVVGPLAVSGLDALVTRRSDPAATVSSGLSRGFERTVLLVFVLAIIVLRGDALLPAQNRQSIAASYPVEAVTALGPRMRAVHTFSVYRWGGYLIWRRIPVFIDGRTDLYGDEFAREYLSLISHPEVAASSLSARGASLALLPVQDPLSASLAHAQCPELHRDTTSVVFDLDHC
jgi:hypothetical protein